YRVLYGLMAASHMDYQSVENVCDTFSTPQLQSQCYADVAQGLISTDVRLADIAIGACTRAKDKRLNDSKCWTALDGQSTAVFVRGSSEERMFCEKLPAVYRKICVTMK